MAIFAYNLGFPSSPRDFVLPTFTFWPQGNSKFLKVEPSHLYKNSPRLSCHEYSARCTYCYSVQAAPA